MPIQHSTMNFQQEFLQNKQQIIFQMRLESSFPFLRPYGLNDRPVEWTESAGPHEVYDVYCNYLLILKMAVCNEARLHEA